MKSDSEKTNFDLSLLNLEELIRVYQNIIDFQQFLQDKKIVKEQEK